jgi:hypothetical protein
MSSQNVVITVIVGIPNHRYNKALVLEWPTFIDVNIFISSYSTADLSDNKETSLSLPGRPNKRIAKIQNLILLISIVHKFFTKMFLSFRCCRMTTARWLFAARMVFSWTSPPGNWNGIALTTTYARSLASAPPASSCWSAAPLCPSTSRFLTSGALLPFNK